VSLVSTVKLMSAIIIVLMCSWAMGAEDAKQLVSFVNSPAIAAHKLPSGGLLKNIIDDLRRNATDEQYQLITKAIAASPALAVQLTTLAENRLITRFIIAPSSSPLVPINMFGAQISGTDWVFTPSFLEQQGTIRIFDVVYEGDILPNNMVFALGHLAFHAEHKEQFKKDEEALTKITDSEAALAEAYRRGVSPPTERWGNLRLRYEAGAFIQGWNDVVDAAVLENHGNKLSARQVASLIMNLRNRWLFFKEMHGYNLFADSGQIEQNDANVEAIVAVLHNSIVMDIE
jgi:hypothetical protein